MGATTKTICPVCGSTTATSMTGVNDLSFTIEICCHDCWVAAGNCKGCTEPVCMTCRVVHVIRSILKTDCVGCVEKE